MARKRFLDRGNKPVRDSGSTEEPCRDWSISIILSHHQAGKDHERYAPQLWMKQDQLARSVMKPGTSRSMPERIFVTSKYDCWLECLELVVVECTVHEFRKRSDSMTRPATVVTADGMTATRSPAELTTATNSRTSRIGTTSESRTITATIGTSRMRDCADHTTVYWKTGNPCKNPAWLPVYGVCVGHFAVAFPILALSVLTSFPAVAGDVESPAAIRFEPGSTREQARIPARTPFWLTKANRPPARPDLSPDSHVLEQTRRQVSELAIELSRLRDEVDSLKAGRRRGMKVKTTSTCASSRVDQEPGVPGQGSRIPVIGRTAGFDDDDCFSFQAAFRWA